MNSPRIIMNFIYYPDGGHRTRIIICKFVDNYMAIICLYLNTNCVILAIRMGRTRIGKRCAVHSHRRTPFLIYCLNKNL